MRITSAAIVSLLVCASLSAADWPTYQADAARSAVSSEKLSFPLATVWEFHPLQPPQPAWPEPGKELHRMDFDYTFQPVIAGGMVYFGSSADDAVRCLDAATGRVRWLFVCGGPVRFAPVCFQGRVCVVSDDGFVYGLDGRSGSLQWKRRLAPAADQLLGNDRMVSRWPVRGGPVIADSVLYVAAGMWPSHGVFLYAIEPADGSVRWRSDAGGLRYVDLPHGGASGFSSVCPQGYLLAPGSALVVPAGRSIPALFDRRTGGLTRYTPAVFAENGGAWATAAEGLLFNPRHGAGPDIDAHRGEALPLSTDGMAAYNISDGSQQLDAMGMHRVVVNSGVLYGAGNGRVAAVDLQQWRTSGKLDAATRWTSPCGHPYSMALAGDALLVGSGGSLTAFSASDGKQLWSRNVDDQVRGLAVSDGAVIAATERGTLLCFKHEQLSVPPLVVDEGPALAPLQVDGATAEQAAAVLAIGGTTSGYALVLAGSSAALATALAVRSDLSVLCVLADTTAVDRERRRLVTGRLAGTRVSVQPAPPDGSLPFAPYFADLVVVTDVRTAPRPAELYRVLRPCGGTLCFAGPSRRDARAFARSSGATRSEILAEGRSTVVRRAALPGAGEWTSQWADPGRTRVGSESRLHAPYDLLWFGEPGPDLLLNRHWQPSAPLSLNGRVFMTGQHHVLAYNAYNGTQLWTVALPGAGRMVSVNSEGNFVADSTSLYVASGGSCVRLDQATGRTLAVYEAPATLMGDDSAASQTADTQEVDVTWPTEWLAAGPLPASARSLPGDLVRTIPAALRVENRDYPLAPLATASGVLDFSYLYGGFGFKPLAKGEKPLRFPRGVYLWDDSAAMRVAYAFAPIRCSRAGRLTIGAGADYFMQWYLDGKVVYTTVPGGNAVKPFAITNHVFTVDVTAGEHVLAVMVQAGSAGWNLTCAGGRHYQPYWALSKPVRVRGWGCLAVAGDRIVGTVSEGEVEGRDPTKPYFYASTSLFALDRASGAPLWTYRAQRSITNQSVAIGGDTVFFVDGPAWSERALRPDSQAVRTLTALSLRDGRVLWRQPGLPPAHGYEDDDVQYRLGRLVLDGCRAFGAATGKLLWQRPRSSPRAPALLYDDWVVEQPCAFSLSDGAQRLVPNPITGEPQPWAFARAYGCGPAYGCRTSVFFRSGAPGIFDLAHNGTTTFCGIRAGCGVNMVPAGGLLQVPEAASGCACSYNFQTTLALVPADSTAQPPWYVFGGSPSSQPLKQLRVNLGAIGDRRDADGTPWFALPHPGPSDAAALPVSMESPDVRLVSAAVEPKGGSAPGWVYSSGVACEGTLSVRLQPVRSVIAAAVSAAPAIDGSLSDACWRSAEPLPFLRNARAAESSVRFYACRDSANIYLGYCRTAARRGDTVAAFVATERDKDSRLWGDDAMQVYFTDSSRGVAVELGLGCAGGWFDGLVRKVGQEAANNRWDCRWQHAVRMEPLQWTAELAMPLATLKEAGINAAALQLNIQSQNSSGDATGRVWLADPVTPFHLCSGFMPLATSVAPVPQASYTVRLHFAEPDTLVAGQRVFDVTVQGDTLLRAFDPVKAAGGGCTPVVRECTGVKAGSELRIGLRRSVAGKGALPLLCGLEVLAE